MKNRQQRRKSRPKASAKTLVGTVKRHPDGFGFLIPDNNTESDVYVSRTSMEGVMSNDKVEVEVFKKGDRFRGEITQILNRGTRRVSGRVHCLNPSQGLMADESLAWGEDLKLSWSRDHNSQEGDWVVAEITSYPDSVRGFQGEIQVRLGDIRDPLHDNERVLALHQIPQEFSKKAKAEAERLPESIQASDRVGRKDLTKKPLITIDGVTAKDFDDAIFGLKRKRGAFGSMWRLQM